MILRSLSPAATQPTPQAGWPAFEATQHDVTLPCRIITQPAHAELSGALARMLKPEWFGPLPPEIVEAIRLHDAGWQGSDARQLTPASPEESNPGHDSEPPARALPLSFIEISTARSTQAWRRSIRHAETISDAAGVIVSRHFCSLAQSDDPHHRAFLREEVKRRKPRETAYANPENLTRWLGALGFCDLFSLLLCSGTQQAVTFPLAHPNMPEARQAPQITIQCSGERIHTQPAVLDSALHLAAQTVLLHPDDAREHERLSWRVG